MPDRKRNHPERYATPLQRVPLTALRFEITQDEIMADLLWPVDPTGRD